MGNSPGPVNSPHKGPVTRKKFPFDDVIMLSPTIMADHGWVVFCTLDVNKNFCMDDTFDKYCMKCSAPLFDGKLNYLVQFDYAAFDISINSCNNYLRNGTVWNFEFLDIELWVTFSNASLANKANELIHPAVVCYHHKYHHRGHIKILKIEMYGKTSNIRGIKSPNLNVSRLILQLFLVNPLKPGVESRMKV